MPKLRRTAIIRHGTMRSDVQGEDVPWGDLEHLEGFMLEGGKLVKPYGMTAINLTRFDGRITGIGEWRRKT